MLIFDRVDGRNVRILRAEPAPGGGGACRLWPFDADALARPPDDDAAPWGAGEDDLSDLLDPGPEAAAAGGGEGAPAWPSRSEAVPGAISPLRPIGGPNDGLSLVAFRGARFLLKRAKPNVEDGSMLSARAMRRQLRVAWAAHAIHRAVGEGPRGAAGRLYEYETVCADFGGAGPADAWRWRERDDSALGNLTGYQEYPGSFLLFPWPDDDAGGGGSGGGGGGGGGGGFPEASPIADSLLGVPRSVVDQLHGALHEQHRHPRADGRGLAPAQRALLLHAMKLDHAFDGHAVERGKRAKDPLLRRAESVLELLRDHARAMPDTAPVLAGLRRFQYSAAADPAPGPAGPGRGIRARIELLASLIDACAEADDGAAKRGYCVALQKRIDLLQELLRAADGDAAGAATPAAAAVSLQGLDPWTPADLSRRWSSGSLSSSHARLPLLGDGLVEAINASLRTTPNRIAVLFAEPLALCEETQAAIGRPVAVGRHRACCELLWRQFAASVTDTAYPVEMSLEVATRSALVSAAHNHSVVVLQTDCTVEAVTGSQTVVNLVLEAERWGDTVLRHDEWALEAFSDAAERGLSNPDQRTESQMIALSNYMSLLNGSRMKVLVVLTALERDQSPGLSAGVRSGSDSDHSKSAGDGPPTISVIKDLRFHIVYAQGPEEGLCEFMKAFYLSLRDTNDGHMITSAFKSAKNSVAGVEGLLFQPQRAEPLHLHRKCVRPLQDAEPGQQVRSGERQATAARIHFSGPRFNDVISEIVKRLLRPYISPREVHFQNLSVRLDAFVLWPGIDNKTNDEGLEVIHVYGQKGDSSISELALELAYYCIYRPRMRVFAKRGMDASEFFQRAEDFVFFVSDTQTEFDLCDQLRQAREEPELPCKHRLLIVDATKLSAVNLYKMFSFPSDVLRFIAECGVQLVLFSSSGQSSEDPVSCLHSSSRVQTDLKMPLEYANTPQINKRELQAVLEHNGLALSEWKLSIMMERDDVADANVSHADFMDIARYLLDCPVPNSRRHVIIDEMWAKDTMMRSVALRGTAEDKASTDDVFLELLRWLLASSESLSSSNIQFETIRAVAMLPEDQVVRLAADSACCSRVDNSWVLNQIFSFLEPVLKHALLFCAMLPEDTAISTRLFQSEALLRKRRQAADFWEECWHSFLACETTVTVGSASLMQRLVVVHHGSQTTAATGSSQQVSLECKAVFDWLQQSSAIFTPVPERRTFSYLMGQLARRGLVVEDSEQDVPASYIRSENFRVFNIPSSIRRFCLNMLEELQRLSATFARILVQRKLVVVDAVIANLQAQTTIYDCTRELDSTRSLWCWAVDTQLEEQTVEASCLVSTLLWVVRKSIRAFMSGEDDTEFEPGERQQKRAKHLSSLPWRKLVEEWTYQAYQPLCIEIDRTAGESSAPSLHVVELAAARLLYIQAYAKLSYSFEEADGCCIQAEKHLVKSQDLCQCDEAEVFKAELHMLRGKIHSEDKDKKSRTYSVDKAIFNFESAKIIIDQLVEQCPRVDAMLPCLKAEVLNFVGNCYRLNVKGVIALEKASECYKQSCLEDRSAFDMPNFHSHNIGLSLLDLYEARMKAASNEKEKNLKLLRDSWCHLLNAAQFRSKVASSKSFQSILRLCDTYRTLTKVRDLCAAEGIHVSLSNESEGFHFHKEQLTLMRRLRTCAKSVEDRTMALDKLEKKWIREGKYCYWKKGLNCSIMVLEVSGRMETEQLDFAVELIRTWSGLRIDMGAPAEYLLGMCPACHRLCALADDAVKSAYSPSVAASFVASANTLRQIARAPAAQHRDYKWRDACSVSARALLARWAPLLAEACAAGLDDAEAASPLKLKGGWLPPSVYVAEPELSASLLLWSGHDDGFNDKDRASLLLSCAAALLAKLTTERLVAEANGALSSDLQSGKKGASQSSKKANNGGRDSNDSQGRESYGAESTQSRIRTLLLIWYAVASKTVRCVALTEISPFWDAY